MSRSSADEIKAVLESTFAEKPRGRQGEPKMRSRAPENYTFPAEASNDFLIRWENNRLCIISAEYTTAVGILRTWQSRAGAKSCLDISAQG
ncbi:hypothetical protein BELL_0415g00050 [Botrytis elliptica]|uniref:Uncharacterized protein n=1 Tax=Botrytis elliptica TaxID=278938 RepID=A0A4Z1JGJ3_9HELO|nr:hypothetical protein BELL_0415g00050 [Botrytis elliptica]